MKANEAPEKLYVSPISFEVGKAFISILTSKSKGDIEYTRTDAFIEKACKFFEEYLTEEECKFGSSEWIEIKSSYEFNSLESFIRAFKRYIED